MSLRGEASRGVPGDRPHLFGVESPGDRALLLGLLLLLAVAVSLSPIRNYDYWWHLATGRLIIEQHAVPRVDPYSFTAAGTPWRDHEWLFQVLAYLGQAALGPAGLIALKVLAVLGLGLLMASHLGREGHGPAGVAVILTPALLGCSFRLDVRPELCTLLLVPLAIHLVLRAREQGAVAPLAAVPLLVALGSSLHVGVIVLPVILALGAAVTFVSERWMPAGFDLAPHGGAAPPFAGRLLGAALASAVATGLNPYGFRIDAVPFEVARVLASIPSPNLEWARPDPAAFPLFFVAAAVLVLVIILGLRRIDPVATPAALLAAALAAAHLRNIGLFFLLLPYGVARPARCLVDALQRRRLYRVGTAGGRVRPGFIAAVVLLLAGVPALLYLPPRVVWGVGVASDNQPSEAVGFLKREGVGRRLFNDVKFGGYLIWRRYPADRVFIDGRNEVYGGLLREIFGALDSGPAWEALLDRFQIDSAFLRYPPTLQRIVTPADDGRPARTSERAFSVAHFPRERWALVYWDDDAMVFLRRSEEYRQVIARCEYREIHPDDWRYVFAGVLARKRPAGPVLEEIRRKLGEDPSCARARMLLAVFTRLAEGLAAAGFPGETRGR